MNFYKLYQGDCFKTLPKIDDESIDYVITDPPYNVGKDYGNKSDKQKEKDYLDFLSKFVLETKRVLREGGLLIVFVPIKNIDKIYRVFSEYLTYEWTMCHYAPNKRSLSSFGYNLWQPILLYNKGEKSKHNRSQDTFKINTGQENFDHPTPKPIKLMEKIIEKFTEEDSIILDPFLGSGTTMEACQNRRRSCIGVELNPSYCDVIKQRCFKKRFLDREVKYEFIIVESEV